MILFFGGGRLGNQIFQYAFLKSIGLKNQLIITYNFKEILNLFEYFDNIINIENKYLRFAIRKILLPVLNILSVIRIISSYKVNKIKQGNFLIEDTTYTHKKGIFPISYIYECHVQSEIFFNPLMVANLSIKEAFQREASSFLEVVPSGFNKVFVHVRRGDYLWESILGKKGLTLPRSYYLNQILWFQTNIKNPYFIFLTDDPEFVEYCFDNIKNKVISQKSMLVDFSIMTSCDYGILSNSSFSWWAAYMMKNRVKVFAPKYWLGWKSNVEFQRGIHPSFAELVEVFDRADLREESVSCDRFTDDTRVYQGPAREDQHL